MKNAGREIVLLATGAFVSAALITYDGGCWKPDLRRYAPWALTPYAILLFGSLSSRLLGLHEFARPILRWGVAIIALSGPLLYLNVLFLDPDAQGGLAVLMIPFSQAAASAPLVVALHLSGWVVLRSQALTPSPRPGPSRTRRATGIALAGAASCLALAWIAISILQSLDRQAIDTAREMDLYIRTYCNEKAALPPVSRLRERFPAASPDRGWFYFSDNDLWLRLQYPVRWRNRNAIGTPRTSEFTATTYAYSVEYQCAALR